MKDDVLFMTRGVKTEGIADIRNEYVTSINHVPLQELSDKYHISFQTLKEYCRRDNWVKQREDYHQKLTVESYNHQLKRAVEHRTKEIKVVESVWAAIAKRIFEAIEAGEYTPTPADLDKMTRLHAYLLGEPDMRHGIRREEDRSEIQSWLTSLQKELPKNGDNA